MRSIILALMLSSVASAEITITTQNLRVVTGVKIVGGQVQIDDAGKLAVTAVCNVGVTTPSKFVDVVARRFVISGGSVQVESATVTSLANRLWQLTGKGNYNLEVVAFDPVNGIERKSVDITIADSDPLPDTIVLEGLQLEARNAIIGLVRGMATDMRALSMDIERGKYKSVFDASAANNVADEVTRNVFKRAMAKSMQPLLGSGQLPPTAPKVFSDIAIGFGSVK